MTSSRVALSSTASSACWPGVPPSLCAGRRFGRLGPAGRSPLRAPRVSWPPAPLIRIPGGPCAFELLAARHARLLRARVVSPRAFHEWPGIARARRSTSRRWAALKAAGWGGVRTHAANRQAPALQPLANVRASRPGVSAGRARSVVRTAGASYARHDWLVRICTESSAAVTRFSWAFAALRRPSFRRAPPRAPAAAAARRRRAHRIRNADASTAG